MKVKGVNLGNWLVLEKWMSPALFAGTTAEDEYYLPRQLSKEVYEARIKIHRSEYITERDFVTIKSMGMEAVRIPVPYFIFGLSAMMLRAFGRAVVNGIEPLNEGIEKLLFRGGGYWFLYVSFMIFMFYPALDKVLNKCFWLEVASCATLLIIDQCVAVTSFLTLNTIIHYLPYFISTGCTVFIWIDSIHRFRPS